MSFLGGRFFATWPDDDFKLSHSLSSIILKKMALDLFRGFLMFQNDLIF